MSGELFITLLDDGLHKYRGVGKTEEKARKNLMIVANHNNFTPFDEGHQKYVEVFKVEVSDAHLVSTEKAVRE